MAVQQTDELLRDFEFEASERLERLEERIALEVHSPVGLAGYASRPASGAAAQS